MRPFNALDHQGKKLQSKYNTFYWSDGYFHISDEGELQVCPTPERGHQVSLKAIVAKAREEGLRLPLLIRFTDILRDRVNRICTAFHRVAAELDYRGHYQVVYPIKVNQQKPVAEALLKNDQYTIGLEAGSKPELVAVLALLANSRIPRTVVCNGYKDRSFIKLALCGQKMGHTIFLVVEKSAELKLILEEAKKLNVKPMIGLRARLASIGKGNWQNTGGEKSKFGLSAHQIIHLVDQLKAADALDCLRLLHFHLGSQIANIRDIQRGIHECAQFYRQLHQLGAPIDTVDIGGGLGVDYEGTRSRTACSINYGIAEYAYNVLSNFQELCDRFNLPHPDIISESGRALTAHHAVLITNVIESERPDDHYPTLAPSETSPHALRSLWNDVQSLKEQCSQRSIVEIYHDAQAAIEEINELFCHGDVDLNTRAQAESLHIQCCRLIRGYLRQDNRTHRDIQDKLNEKLADKLFVNFSLFQSVPDIWGIDQIFPILPLDNIHLSEQRRVVIQDITCDSDGRVDQYVTEQGLETTLPLPEPVDDNPLEIGFFMVGAYQEILGDMHNLFGDTDSVDVALNENGHPLLSEPIPGDTVKKVLDYVHYSEQWLTDQYNQLMTNGKFSQEDKQQIRALLKESLVSYTYLE